VQISILTLAATIVAKTYRVTSWTTGSRLGIRPNNRARNHLSVCGTLQEQRHFGVAFRDLPHDMAVPWRAERGRQ
jgi:hypothetical protein